MKEIQNDEIQYNELLKTLQDKVEYLKGCL